MNDAPAPSLARLQRQILLGGGPAILIVGFAGLRLVLASPDIGADAGSAMQLAARWLVVPALCLWAGIQFVAGWRFMHRADNPGSAETASVTLEIALRYTRNSLEQGVLAAMTWISFAATWPERAAAVVPVLAILYAVGRATFWIGYRITPPARAFGFVLTFLPTAAVLLATCLAQSGLL